MGLSLEFELDRIANEIDFYRERADVTMGDLLDDHFGPVDVSTADGRAKITLSMPIATIKADIVYDYLGELRKASKELRSIADQLFERGRAQMAKDAATP